MSELPAVIELGPEEEAQRLWIGAEAAHESASQDLVALCESLDLGLRVPVLGPLIFDTPLIHLFRWGARMDYLIWLALKGRQYQREIREHSWYAQQGWPSSDARSSTASSSLLETSAHVSELSSVAPSHSASGGDS